MLKKKNIIKIKDNTKINIKSAKSLKLTANKKKDSKTFNVKNKKIDSKTNSRIYSSVDEYSKNIKHNKVNVHKKTKSDSNYMILIESKLNETRNLLKNKGRNIANQVALIQAVFRGFFLRNNFHKYYKPNYQYINNINQGKTLIDTYFNKKNNREILGEIKGSLRPFNECLIKKNNNATNERNSNNKIKKINQIQYKSNSKKTKSARLKLIHDNNFFYCNIRKIANYDKSNKNKNQTINNNVKNNGKFVNKSIYKNRSEKIKKFSNKMKNTSKNENKINYNNDNIQIKTLPNIKWKLFISMIEHIIKKFIKAYVFNCVFKNISKSNIPKLHKKIYENEYDEFDDSMLYEDIKIEDQIKINQLSQKYVLILDKTIRKLNKYSRKNKNKSANYNKYKYIENLDNIYNDNYNFEDMNNVYKKDNSKKSIYSDELIIFDYKTV